MPTILEQIETEIAKAYQRMTGVTPVGLTDTLRILTHPDMIDGIEAYIREKRIQDYRDARALID